MKTSFFRTNAVRYAWAIFSFSVALTMPLTAQSAGYEGAPITFEQIYENPDDQKLNFNYARQQAAKGDFISAAAALERMLYSQPNWDSARLFYALVLFKLDDTQAANKELDALDNRPLTASQRQQVQAYRQKFSGSKNTTQKSNFAGQVSVGLRYDDNAGNALTDTLIVTTNKSDIAATLQGQLNYTAALNDKGMAFTASAYGNSTRHDNFPKADYDSFGGSLGVVGKASESIAWALDAQLSQVHISGSKYLSQIGGQIKLSTPLGEKSNGWISGGWYDQKYSDLPITLLETTRSGDKVIAKAGLDYHANTDATFGISIGYEDKKAQAAAFAYDGFRVEAHGFRGFSNGVYVNGKLALRKLNYDDIVTQREDTHTIARVAVGSSLSTISQWMGANTSSLDNTYLEVGGNFTNRDSNITASNYDNVGADVKLVWTF